MTLYIKKLREEAVIPERSTPQSAGIDISACISQDITINPRETVMIPTGIAAAPSESDCVLLIYARSGLAARHGIVPANCVGVVDSDYRGEIMVALTNNGSEAFTVTNGMRVAQLVVTPVFLPRIEERSELNDTERGAGGFGSTGI